MSTSAPERYCRRAMRGDAPGVVGNTSTADEDKLLHGSRTALAHAARRLTALLARLNGPRKAVAGSEWTVSDIAVHLVHGARLYAQLVREQRSPVADLADLETLCRAFIAEFPGPDTDRVAALINDAVAELLDATAGRTGAQPVVWHGGLRCTLAEAMSILLGEYVVHGYDIAGALQVSWPIDPAHARMIIRGYKPLLPVLVNPETAAGHTASYAVDLGEEAAFIARFTDGELRINEPDGRQVDSVVSAEPVAYLLVMTGRLTTSAAIALGLLHGRGSQPSLAYRYPDLFVY